MAFSEQKKLYLFVIPNNSKVRNTLIRKNNIYVISPTITSDNLCTNRLSEGVLLLVHNEFTESFPSIHDIMIRQL